MHDFTPPSCILQPSSCFFVFIREIKDRNKRFSSKDINIIAVNPNVVCILVLEKEEINISMKTACGLLMPNTISESLISVLFAYMLGQAQACPNPLCGVLRYSCHIALLFGRSEQAICAVSPEAM